MSAWIRDLAAQRQAFRKKFEERLALRLPDQGPDWGGSDKAFPVWRSSHRDAILQPPKPQLTPSVEILTLAAEHDTEPEAAD